MKKVLLAVTLMISLSGCQILLDVLLAPKKKNVASSAVTAALAINTSVVVIDDLSTVHRRSVERG